jgi:ATP-binding cassette, subfamily B, multidrug efflux pump
MAGYSLIGWAKKYPFWGRLWPYRRSYAVGLLSLMLVDALNVALPLVLKNAIDALPAQRYDRVVTMAVLYMALMGCVALGRYFWRVFLIGSSHRIARDLRLQFYGHLLKLPVGSLQTVRSGDLMSRATNDVESVRMAVGPGVLVSVDAVLLFALIVPVMLSLSVKLTLIAFAFFPLVPWITAKFGDRIDKLFDSLQAKMAKLSALTQESFASVRLIKSLVLEGPTLERFLRLSGDYRGEGERLARVEAPFGPVLSFLTYAGTFGILYFGGKEVVAGAITIGTFVAFQRFVVQLAWPMEAIGWAVTMNREGAAAHRRLTQILALAPVEPVRAPAASRVPDAPLLEVRRLEFSYPGSRFGVQLGDVRLERGKKVGIVGPVGAGKSTFLNLILRLYETEPGSVLFEGRDVAGIALRELRREVGNVEQQIFLFSESLAENVSLGRSTVLGESALKELAETAAIGAEIRALPEGFRTRLGERGVDLSGGQKQRLALMRALGREPKLLLLDDALSAVDVEVEERILEALLSKYRELGVLFVSHRLSVMPRLDEVWVMREGRLAARGTHGRLLRDDAWYAGLWEKTDGGRLAERPAEART